MPLIQYLEDLYVDKDRLLRIVTRYENYESEIKKEAHLVSVDDDGCELWNVTPESQEKYQKELSDSYLWSCVLPAQRDNEVDEYYRLLSITAHFYAYQELEPPYSVLCDETGPNFDKIEDFLQKKFCTVAYKGLLYIFVNGQFLQNSGQIEREFQKILKFSGYTQKKRFKPVCDDMLHRIMVESSFLEYPFNQSVDVVSVKNGVITRSPYHKLLPKSPVWGMTYSLNVNWKDKTEVDTCCIEEFLHSLVDPDDVKQLTFIPASALFNGQYCYKSHLFVGRGSNGKSTYLRFLTSIFGEQNISSLSLNEMCNEKFKRAELVGRLLNICGDLPKKPVKNSDEYKKITGRDPITVERKHGQPFQIVSSAVMLFATNELPIVDDDSDGWWRRWDIIQFPHHFKQDPNYESRILTAENREAFLHLLLRAMDEIELYGTVESESMEEIRENWKRQSNSGYGFLKGNIIESPTGVILYDDLYRAYTAWSEDEGLAVMTKAKFSDEVKKLYNVEKIRRGTRGSQKHYWKGIEYMSFDICPESESMFSDSWRTADGGSKI